MIFHEIFPLNPRRSVWCKVTISLTPLSIFFLNIYLNMDDYVILKFSYNIVATLYFEQLTMLMYTTFMQHSGNAATMLG